MPGNIAGLNPSNIQSSIENMMHINSFQMNPEGALLITYFLWIISSKTVPFIIAH